MREVNFRASLGLHLTTERSLWTPGTAQLLEIKTKSKLKPRREVSLDPDSFAQTLVQTHPETHAFCFNLIGSQCSETPSSTCCSYADSTLLENAWVLAECVRLLILQMCSLGAALTS